MAKFNDLSDDTKKKIIIGVGFLLIILIIVFAYVKRQNSNYNSIKIKRNENLVYSLKEEKNDIYRINVPYVNIKGDTCKAINEDISLFANELLEKDMVNINYEYDITGYILSLIVKAVDYDTEFAPKPYFRSYNINLKNLSLIDNKTLLDNYDTNENEVEKIIEKKLTKYYDELVDLEYYDERECNYECFLKYREIDSYLDDVVYFVREGKLIAFKPYIFYSIYGEEEYFTEKHFEFVIKES